MKTTAILYEQHIEVARVPIDKLEFVYAIKDGLRVATSIEKIHGYEQYDCDEIEFVCDHIADNSKKASGDSIISNDPEEAAEKAGLEYEPIVAGEAIDSNGQCYETDDVNWPSRCGFKNGFKAGANWQKEQLRDLCYQCEKNYDTVFYRGEQHAIKMMEKETISGEVVQNYSGEYALYIKAKLPKRTYLKFGDKVAVYIFKKNTL